MFHSLSSSFFFFFNDTATTEIYTLSLHDALPISSARCAMSIASSRETWLWLSSPSLSRIIARRTGPLCGAFKSLSRQRSEEHTSELQSQSNLVCRLLLEKKKTTTRTTRTSRYYTH